MSLYTCECKAIFPPVPFCPFCGKEVPVDVLFTHGVEQEEEAEALGFQISPPSRCNDEEHLLSAMTAKLFRGIPSGNGEIQFCSKCGKKLAEV